MIDSHCHLDHDPLIANINDILVRSKNVGITKLLTICTTFESFEKIKKLIKLDSIIYGTCKNSSTRPKNIINEQMIIEMIKNEKKIIE